MKPSRPIAIALLACMAPWVTGCYSFKPMATTEVRPDPGKQVRVHLNEPASVRLQNVTAEGVVEMNGELAEWDNGQVVLSVFWLRSTSGFEQRAEGETVVVEEANIREFTYKQINLPLSIGLAAAAVVAAVVVGSAFSAGGGGGNEPGGGGGPADRRGTIF